MNQAMHRQLLNSPALASNTCNLQAVKVADSLGSSPPTTSFIRQPHLKKAVVLKADAKLWLRNKEIAL